MKKKQKRSSRKMPLRTVSKSVQTKDKKNYQIRKSVIIVAGVLVVACALLFVIEDLNSLATSIFIKNGSNNKNFEPGNKGGKKEADEYNYPEIKESITNNVNLLPIAKKDKIGSNIIFNNGTVADVFKDSYDDFYKTLEVRSDIGLSVVEINKINWHESEANKIAESFVQGKNLKVDKSKLKELLKDLKGNKDSYLILADADKNLIQVYAYNFTGLLNGMTTVQNYAASKRIFQEGFYFDLPDHKRRILYMNFKTVKADNEAEKKAEIENKLNQIRLARKYHYNEIMVSVSTDGVKLKSVENWKRKCLQLYDDPNKTLTKDEFKEILKIANENGLNVFPQMQLLTHQNKFFKNCFPELMIKGSQSYDPKKVAVSNGNKGYEEIVFPVLREVVELTKKYTGSNGVDKDFNIGHDEAVVDNNDPSCQAETEDSGCIDSLDKYAKCKRPIVMSAEDFAFDVNKIYKDFFVKEYPDWNMWIYGDMLLNAADIKMSCYNPLHGDEQYAKLIDDGAAGLSKKIGIVDWNYFNQKEFSTTKTFIQHGYKTLGMHWGGEKKICAFSKDAKDFGAAGMVTAYFLTGGTPIEELIPQAGRIYWNVADDRNKCK